MISALQNGIPGTAMQSFRSVLSKEEIGAVVDFVRRKFMEEQAPNTRYHTEENGWFDHQRYVDAFPFALGEIALDTPWESLNASQRRGKQLFLQSCITCHDRAHVKDEGVVWDARPLSYPRNGYSHKNPQDSLSGATPYARNEEPPHLEKLSPQEQRGKELFEQNCAFCHAMNGTGKNWIGRFLEPHPRNLAEAPRMQAMNIDKLSQAIADGVVGSAMPAWKTVLSEEQIHTVAAYVLQLYLQHGGDEKAE